MDKSWSATFRFEEIENEGVLSYRCTEITIDCTSTGRTPVSVVDCEVEGIHALALVVYLLYLGGGAVGYEVLAKDYRTNEHSNIVTKVIYLRKRYSRGPIARIFSALDEGLKFHTGKQKEGIEITSKLSDVKLSVSSKDDVGPEQVVSKLADKFGIKLPIAITTIDSTLDDSNGDFEWVKRQLSEVSFHALNRPVGPGEINVTIDEPNGAGDSILGGSAEYAAEPPIRLFRLAIPPEDEIIAISKQLGRSPNACLGKIKEVKEEPNLTKFLDPEGGDVLPDSADRLEVFTWLKGNPCFEKCRLLAIEEFLRTQFNLPGGNGFKFNGILLALAGMEWDRLPDGRESIRLVLHLTDYFTYRVIALCSREVRGELKKFLRGIELRDYFPRFQKFIHLSISTLILVHTLKDDKLIIRRRSKSAANFGDGGKLYVSACEGIYKNALSWKNGHYSLDLDAAVRRGLRREVFPEATEGRRDLLKQIKAIRFLGPCAYMPNLSVPLCFYVSVDDCSADEVIAGARKAEHHGEFDFDKDKFDKDEFDKFLSSDDLPKLTLESVNQFLRREIGKSHPNEIWAEGALVTLVLSLNVLRAGEQL